MCTPLKTAFLTGENVDLTPRLCQYYDKSVFLAILYTFYRKYTGIANNTKLHKMHNCRCERSHPSILTITELCVCTIPLYFCILLYTYIRIYVYVYKGVYREYTGIASDCECAHKCTIVVVNVLTRQYWQSVIMRMTNSFILLCTLYIQDIHIYAYVYIRIYRSIQRVYRMCAYAWVCTLCVQVCTLCVYTYIVHYPLICVYCLYQSL